MKNEAKRKLRPLLNLLWIIIVGAFYVINFDFPKHIS